MCTETDLRFIMRTDFKLPEGHNPVINELTTKKIVSIEYALAHQSTASTKKMGVVWIERIRQQQQDSLEA